MRRVIFNSFLAALALSVVSCEEDNPLDSSSGSAELKLGEYYIEAEGIASYLYNITERAYRDSLLQVNDSTEVWGAKVVITSTSAAEIRFGNGVTGSDGITRKGTVAVTETGSYETQGGKLTLNMVNFSVDDRPVGGTMEFTNSGNNNYNVVVNNFSINSEFSFNASKTINWQTGLATPTDEMDDTYSLTGSFSGTESATGNGIAGNITTPFQYDRACEYRLVSGVVDLSLTGDSLTADTGVIDFKDTDGCHNSVIITINTNNGGTVILPKTFNGF